MSIFFGRRRVGGGQGEIKEVVEDELVLDEFFCGGLQCGRSAFCDFDENCGRADESGTCLAIPVACTQQFLPVCACDGLEYSNACFAAGASVSVDYKGPCSRLHNKPTYVEPDIKPAF